MGETGTENVPEISAAPELKEVLGENNNQTLPSDTEVPDAAVDNVDDYYITPDTYRLLGSAVILLVVFSSGVMSIRLRETLQPIMPVQRNKLLAIELGTLFLFGAFWSGLAIYWLEIPWHTIGDGCTCGIKSLSDFIFSSSPVYDEDPALPDIAQEQSCVAPDVFSNPDTYRLLGSVIIMLVVYSAGIKSGKLRETFKTIRPNFIRGSAWFAAELFVLFLGVTFLSGFMVHWLGFEWHCFGDCLSWSLEGMHNMIFYHAPAVLQEVPELIPEPAECANYSSMANNVYLG